MLLSSFEQQSISFICDALKQGPASNGSIHKKATGVMMHCFYTNNGNLTFRVELWAGDFLSVDVIGGLMGQNPQQNLHAALS